MIGLSGLKITKLKNKLAKSVIYQILLYNEFNYICIYYFKGAFAKVYRAYCIPKNIYAAVKIMDLERVTSNFEDIRVLIIIIFIFILFSFYFIVWSTYDENDIPSKCFNMLWKVSFISINIMRNSNLILFKYIL